MRASTSFGLIVGGLVMSTSTVRGADPASDDFERASLGADWMRLQNSDADIVNGSDLGSPDPMVRNAFVQWASDLFAADQFSEVVLANGFYPDMLAQVWARRRPADLARYGFHYNGDPGKAQWEIKYDGVPSTETRILALLAAPSGPAAGDRLRIEVVGENPVIVRGYYNDTLLLEGSDAEPQRITGPSFVGMVARLRGGGSGPPNSAIWESWRGGSIAFAMVDGMPDGGAMPDSGATAFDDPAAGGCCGAGARSGKSGLFALIGGLFVVRSRRRSARRRHR